MCFTWERTCKISACLDKETLICRNKLFYNRIIYHNLVWFSCFQSKSTIFLKSWKTFSSKTWNQGQWQEIVGLENRPPFRLQRIFLPTSSQRTVKYPETFSWVVTGKYLSFIFDISKQIEFLEKKLLCFEKLIEKILIGYCILIHYVKRILSGLIYVHINKNEIIVIYINVNIPNPLWPFPYGQ